MAYIKNQILQNNALEAWAMSIRYCDYILEGKATLEYRKHFVSALYNTVELFVKQLMLNNTDYRVIHEKWMQFRWTARLCYLMLYFWHR